MPDSPLTVSVRLPLHSYDIEIAAGLCDRLGERLSRLGHYQYVTVVTDTNVAPLFGDRAGRSLLAAGIDYALIAIPAGDASKSLDIAAGVYEELAALRHDRSQPIIALGGGVVGDLAGFVAATWHRGVPFVQCPTTLEAIIDASIGGKTAINLPSGKNLIGAFHQPILVCIDPDCLKTLSERDFRAGLAESVKHAVVDAGAGVKWQALNCDLILNRDESCLRELIRWNCAVKATIVAADEREKERDEVGRAALNFGHTIGHALEATSGYELRHGEAVALGLIAEMDLAVHCCGFPESQREPIEKLLHLFGLPTTTKFDPQEIIAWIKSDKKNRDGKVRFVVPRRMGELVWLDSVSQQDLLAALTRIRAA